MFDEQKVKDDLYNAVNSEWEKTAEIPADKVSTGGFNDLSENVEKLMMQDTKKMLNGEIELTDAEQEKFVSFYKVVLNFEQRDKLGSEPVKPYIEKIKNIKSLQDLQELSIEWSLKDFALPFAAGTASDLSNTDVYAMFLEPTDLLLPDKTYYDPDNESGKQLLAVLRETLTELLPLFGFSSEETKDLIDKGFAYDAKLVPLVRSAEENADVMKMNNPRSIAEVEAYSDVFSFSEFFTTLVGQTPDKIIVTQPNFFEHFDDILSADLLEELKAWMILRLCYGARNILSEDIRQTAGKYELALQGKPSLYSREKASYYLAKGYFSQVVGNYYGKTYFGPEAREDVRSMVKTMVSVYEERLQANEWISPETAQKAIEKLEHLDIFVGYPDYYPKEYKQIEIDEQANLFENVIAIKSTLSELDYKRWNTETDRTVWGMPADLVNAYYDPTNNLICFPAAILQAPFYSLEQTDSQNYGGIGAVMAHEISHGFDNNGSKFDAKGNISNWWKDEDFKIFDQKAQAVIAQYDGLDFAGGKVNGKLTVSENIADLGGLTCALESLKRQENYDLREFFTNWATVWRQKARPEYNQLLLAIDVHAPTYWRANMVPRNLDDFHTTFATAPGDGMYLEKDKRITIW